MKLKDLSIKIKLALLSSVFTVALVIVVILTVSALNEQADGQLGINVAGRQRMLSQKYTKEVMQELSLRQIKASAINTAEIAATQIVEDRAAYTKNVIGKLKKEWPEFKASVEHRTTKGAIPFPATLVRETAAALEKKGTANYRYNLRSKWNLSPGQGLKTDFEHKAWDNFSNGTSKSFTMLVKGENQSANLLYARADFAVVQGCVDCHNAWEKKPDIVKLRGDDAGKKFKLNELMGMLVIETPASTNPELAKMMLSDSREKSFQKSKTLFEKSLNALTKGGETFSDVQMKNHITLSAYTDSEFQGLMSTVDGHWKKLMAATTAALSEPVNSPTYLEAINNIEKENVNVLKNMNAGVARLMEVNANQSSATKNSQWGILALAVITGLLFTFFISQAITQPLKTAIGVANDLAGGEGDLTRRMNLHRNDEIGLLGKAIDEMLNSQGQMIGGIQEITASLGSSSEELSAISSELQNGSEKTKSQAENVASATEQMSANINSMASAAEEMNVNVNSVSSAAEQMSVNMNSVASSIEEMSATIKQVAENSRNASKVADDASTMSNAATEKMNLLDQAGQEIGKVTDVIKRIAEQTNLLALNATIEAASAGEAGKGFAVVAGEIKELANQSAQAAEDIAQKIEGVQTNTKDAVSVIEEVTGIIGNINQSVTTITQAVEQQEQAANEISRNVSESNDGATSIASSISEVGIGTGDLSKNASEAAKGANDVSENIQEVSQAAQQGQTGADHVNTTSSELAKLAAELKTMVGKFKVE